MTRTPQQIAEERGMKRHNANGKTEWHGANPSGEGATRDGCILNEDGTAYDRKINRTYTSAEAARLFGIEPREYSPCAEYSQEKRNGGSSFDWKAATTFTYRDENGAEIFQVGRIGDGETKQFRQRHRDGGEWKLGAGNRRVLYNLHDVMKAERVLIVEGEKCADELNARLAGAGVSPQTVATTYPNGGTSWREEYCDALRGRAIFVLPDNDPTGRTAAAKIVASLKSAGIENRVVTLPNLPEKGDAFDFLASGGTVETVLQLCKEKEAEAPSADIALQNRFQLLTVAALRQMPPVTWLIDRVLPTGETSMLTAKQGSCKSFAVLDMALCIASGEKWHGKKTEMGAVVYVAAEGVRGLPNRVKAWSQHNGCEEPENFYAIGEPVQMHDAAAFDDFLATVTPLAPKLIVLDTLACCAVGLDENSARDMGQFADALTRLAKATGAHIMAVHHNNKSGSYRGSSAVPAATATHLTIERGGNLITLKCEKQKDGQEFRPMIFETQQIIIGQDRDRREIASLALTLQREETDNPDSLSSVQEKVLRQLLEVKGEAGAAYSEWKRICEPEGIAEATFGRCVRALEAIGAVTPPERKEDGRTKQGARYYPSSQYCKPLSPPS